MIDFPRLIGTLSDGEVAFIIVDGLAATIHGSARLTQDIDLVYARSGQNLARLATALAPLDPISAARLLAFRSSGPRRPSSGG